MGCQGVWVGSAFLTTPEAETEHWKKVEITKANDEATTCSRTYTGKNARSLKNEWIKAWKDEGPAPLGMPLQFILSRETLTRAREDDRRLHAVMVGEAAGMLNEIKPAAQVVAKMAGQAEEILERMGKFGTSVGT
jgi:NAD(P)H-dependent flavin oxidoreductase YrpB (nitropropane dioxygenase family)